MGYLCLDFAVFVTWILFGIWHGAGWNFMILGLLQALAIIYEFFTEKWRISLFSKVPNYFRIWLGRIFTYLFYCGSLVFFFSSNINSAFIYFSKLTEFSGPSLSLLVPLSTIPFSAIIFIIIFFSLELIQNDHNDTYNKLELFWSGKKESE